MWAFSAESAVPNGEVGPSSSAEQAGQVANQEGRFCVCVCVGGEWGDGLKGGAVESHHGGKGGGLGLMEVSMF